MDVGFVANVDVTDLWFWAPWLLDCRTPDQEETRHILELP